MTKKTNFNNSIGEHLEVIKNLSNFLPKINKSINELYSGRA